MTIFNVVVTNIAEEKNKTGSECNIQGHYQHGCPASSTSGSAECEVLFKRIENTDNPSGVSATLFHHVEESSIYILRKKLYFYNETTEIGKTYFFELFYDNTHGNQVETDSLVNLLYLPLPTAIRELNELKYDGSCLWQYTVMPGNTTEAGEALDQLVLKQQPTQECKYRVDEDKVETGCVVVSDIYAPRDAPVTKLQYGLITGLTIGGFSLIAAFVFIVWRRRKTKVDRKSKSLRNQDRTNQQRMTEANPHLADNSEDERFDN